MPSPLLRPGFLPRAPWVAVVLVIAGCASRDAPPPPTGSRVVASIFPVADLLRFLAPEGTSVEVLLPPGASPATFEPGPQAVRSLAAARAVVLVGAGLDPWVRGIVEGAGEARFLEITEGIALLDEAHGHEGSLHGGGNPHIWLDPILVRDSVLPRLAALWIALEPGAEEWIGLRARMLADSLTALDAEVRDLLGPDSGAAFISSHAAWGYFARRYDLREVGVVFESPGNEPSPRALAAMLEEARRIEARAVFAEPQFGTAPVEALAGELGVRVGVLDPLGGPEAPGRSTYFALIRFNAAQFEQGFRATGGGTP